MTFRATPRSAPPRFLRVAQGGANCATPDSRKLGESRGRNRVTVSYQQVMPAPPPVAQRWRKVAQNPRNREALPSGETPLRGFPCGGAPTLATNKEMTDEL
jgi:hypothetical protein